MENYESRQIKSGNINVPKIDISGGLGKMEVTNNNFSKTSFSKISFDDFSGSSDSSSEVIDNLDGYPSIKEIIAEVGIENLDYYVSNMEFKSREDKIRWLLSQMVTDSTDMTDMKINTFCLQNAINTMSEQGGTLYLPAGTFNFAQGGTGMRLDDKGNLVEHERYAILCKNNVNIVGAGSNGLNKTVLKPYDPGRYNKETGQYEPAYGSMDMFYFNNYAQMGFPRGSDVNSTGNVYFRNDISGKISSTIETVYLRNANFSNFVIDGSNVQGKPENYSSAGKGFMINLMENCHWDNVVVQNTDATGFGMDCPINCSISNCTAVNCGKQASEQNGGASGFGIGTGYSNDESITISNCQSYNNKKYGFFFEHQSRFQPDNTVYPATSSKGFVVNNCVAGGNMYDFGGVKAYDVLYNNIRSVSNTYGGNVQARTLASGSSSAQVTTLAYNPTKQITNKFDVDIKNRGSIPISFSEYSVNCRVINSSLGNRINDVTRFEDDVFWAIDNGYVYPDSDTTFSPYTELTRLDTMKILYRYAGMPNGVNLNSMGKIGVDTSEKIRNSKGGIFSDLETLYTDESGGLDSVLWGVNNGILSPDGNFNPDNICSRSQIITMLYRLAGSPKSSQKVDLPFNDLPTDPGYFWYEDALQWGYQTGLINGTSATTFSPDNPLTKEQIAIMLHRFDNLMNNNQHAVAV